MSHQDRPIFGISLRILSGLLMAGMFVMVKAVSEEVPLGQIVFFGHSLQSFRWSYSFGYEKSSRRV